MNTIKKLANNNAFFKFAIYVAFRIYSLLLRLLFLILRVVPVKKNKIVCMNMKGKRYGDNPMYVSDELIKRGTDCDIVWLLNKDVNEKLPDNVRRVNARSLREMYELATAGVWLDSNTKTLGVLKRKNQCYIQTWHGSYGLKKFGMEIPEKISIFDRKIMTYNGKIIDLIVSNSKKTTDIYRKSFGGYNGEVLECGSPRNDIFFENNDVVLNKVRAHFNIQNKKIAMYAPTFRNNFGTESFDLNFESCLKSLENRFGGEWVMLVRLHPNNLKEAATFICYNDRVINASSYSVMQELLVAADVLITDYSSCMFDFATTKKPCFLYATDIENYRQERDYYFELEELPFPLSQNNAELLDVISGFDSEKYNDDLGKLFSDVGLTDNGNASKLVADYIEQYIG